jgi:hypothetical protein
VAQISAELNLSQIIIYLVLFHRSYYQELSHRIEYPPEIRDQRQRAPGESITSGNTKYALPIVILLTVTLVATLPAVQPLLVLFVPFLVEADYLT